MFLNIALVTTFRLQYMIFYLDLYQLHEFLQI